nr:hypothetical protein BN993_01901 [Virgibacillus halodenitrificans]
MAFRWMVWGHIGAGSLIWVSGSLILALTLSFEWVVSHIGAGISHLSG